MAGFRGRAGIQSQKVTPKSAFHGPGCLKKGTGQASWGSRGMWALWPSEMHVVQEPVSQGWRSQSGLCLSHRESWSPSSFCRLCFSQKGLWPLGPAGVSSTPGAGVPLRSLCRCPGRMSRGWLGILRVKRGGNGLRGEEAHPDPRGREKPPEKGQNGT